jgi:hypothetical protein
MSELAKPQRKIVLILMMILMIMLIRSLLEMSENRKFQDHLDTHILGYSDTFWNEERVKKGMPRLSIPIKPHPLQPLVVKSKKQGCFGKTNLENGTILYRGYGNASKINGYDPKQKILNTDRITSFTPFMKAAREHNGPVGGIVCAIMLPSPETVFCDYSACKYKFGCMTGNRRCAEVQLMPGQYHVKNLSWMPSK